jgi:hypothetical protein
VLVEYVGYVLCAGVLLLIDDVCRCSYVRSWCVHGADACADAHINVDTLSAHHEHVDDQSDDDDGIADAVTHTK